MPVNVSMDLTKAIAETNKILAGSSRGQRAFSYFVVVFLVSSALFLAVHIESIISIFLIQNMGGGAAVTGNHFFRPIISSALNLALPESLRLPLDFIVIFAFSLITVAISGYLFSSRDPRLDALTPIRLELAKVVDWEIEMKSLRLAEPRDVSGRVKIEINNEYQKLRVGFEIKGIISVKGEADDVSLQKINDTDISLLFFISEFGEHLNDDIRCKIDFEYLIVVKGGQFGQDKVPRLSGEWYRLSKDVSGLSEMGSCTILPLIAEFR